MEDEESSDKKAAPATFNSILFPTLHDKKGKVRKDIYGGGTRKYGTPETNYRDGKITKPDEPIIFRIPSGISRNNRWSDEGMWLHMGYSARKHGPEFRERREILRRMYVGTFIPGKGADVDYILEFGDPMTKKRKNKILGYLNAQISDKEDDEIMGNAVRKWKDDKAWFINSVP